VLNCPLLHCCKGSFKCSSLYKLRVLVTAHLFQQVLAVLCFVWYFSKQSPRCSLVLQVQDLQKKTVFVCDIPQVLIPRLCLVAQPNLWHLTGLKILWSKYLIGINHPCWQVNVLLQSTKAIRLTGDVAGMWLRAIRWVSQMSSKLLRVNHTCATVYSVQSTWLSSSCCWNVLAELFMSELTWPVWLADNFAWWLLLSVCLSILIRINWV